MLSILYIFVEICLLFIHSSPHFGEHFYFRDYEITKGKMDDVFLAVTGKKLGGDEK